jgi:hypothetical protein
MANLPSGQTMPKGTIATFSQIMSEQGVSAFWRGNMPQVYKVFT